MICSRDGKTMKIMLVDRDREIIEKITDICDDIENIELIVAPTKNTALDMLAKDKYDTIFFDPAPQNTEMRAFIIGVRRIKGQYTPITIMSHQLSSEEAKKFGCNNYIKKPLETEVFKDKLNTANNFSKFYKNLNDDVTDFPSKDGLISKSAFNQIFISCLDRADRYGEETYLISVNIKNIAEIQELHGHDIASKICENLKKYTMKIRRLSDIAGRLSESEICLMLIRPKNADEPSLAVERFVDTMKEYIDLISINDAKIILNINVMAIPSAEVTFSKDIE